MKEGDKNAERGYFYMDRLTTRTTAPGSARYS